MKILKTLLLSFIFLCLQFSSFACNIEVSTTNETIYITGLTSTENTKLFDVDFNLIWECNPWSLSACSDEEKITNLTLGTSYFLSAESENCQIWIPILLNEEILPSCHDGIQNQGETSIDCGGPNCGPCEPNIDECQVEVTNQNGGIIINNLNPDANTKVFDTDFNVLFECNPWSSSPCLSTVSIDDLNEGDYFLSIVSEPCDIWLPIKVENTNDVQRCTTELVGYSNDGLFKQNITGGFSTVTEISDNVFEENIYLADGTLSSINQFEVAKKSIFTLFDNQILELDEDGNLIKFTMIDQGIANIYSDELNYLNSYVQIDEENNFYLIGVNVIQYGEDDDFTFSLIKLDANGNELATILLYDNNLHPFEQVENSLDKLNVAGFYFRPNGGIDVYLVEEIAENAANLRTPLKFEIDPNFNNVVVTNLGWNNISSYLNATVKDLEYCGILQITRKSNIFSVYDTGNLEYTIIDNYDTSSDPPRFLNSTFSYSGSTFECTVTERKTYTINLDNGNTLFMDLRLSDCPAMSYFSEEKNISIFNEDRQVVFREDIETNYDQIIPIGGNEYNYIIGNTLYYQDCEESGNEEILERNQNFDLTEDNIESMYPNPVNDQLFINIKSSAIQNTDFKVYDSLGKLIVEKNYFLEKGSNTFSLDTSNLPNGVYNLIIAGDVTNLKAERFVKL